MRVIVAYDIGDGDRRARVAAVLGRNGVRIQNSVFDCEIDSTAIAVLLDTLGALIDPGRDVVDIVGSCPTCTEQRWSVGQSRAGVVGQLWWVV